MKFVLAFTLPLLLTLSLAAQPKIGINTSAPFRDLEVYGVSGQFIRVHSSTPAAGLAGIEFVRGTNGQSHTDWRIVNDGGNLRFQYGQNNFTTSPTDAMRINSTGHTGIGTSFPTAPMHVDGGSGLAFGGLGYLKLGSHNSGNLTFDNTQLQALDNGLAAPLYLQHNGGNTYFGNNGGHTYIGVGGGHLSAGTQLYEAPLTLQDNDFQFYLQNSSDDINGWYIGATNGTWSAGDNQLVFSPNSSSASAVLRLLDVTENDGTQSPVMLYNSFDNTLMLDGNEIDTRGTPLYINHNSDEETYLNPTGGQVGIGTTNPQAMVHVHVGSGDPLSIQNDNYRWDFYPYVGGTENLTLWMNDVFNAPMAQIHGETGQWMAASDQSLKENIRPLGVVNEKIKNLPLWNYTMIHDATQRNQLGVMAQELSQLYPEMVYESDGQYGVSYAQLAVLGIKYVQEQQSLIDQLQQKIEQIKQIKQSAVVPTSH